MVITPGFNMETAKTQNTPARGSPETVAHSIFYLVNALEHENEYLYTLTVITFYRLFVI